MILGRFSDSFVSRSLALDFQRFVIRVFPAFLSRVSRLFRMASRWLRKSLG